MQASERSSPTPFPYEVAHAATGGTFCLTDMHKYSKHVAIGRPGWPPMLYALCLQDLRQDALATSALARYVDMAGADDALGFLEGWSTRTEAQKSAWGTRFSQDRERFKGAVQRLRDGAVDAARQQWLQLLHAMCPPGQSLVLEAPAEYIRWFEQPEESAWKAQLQQRYAWLQAQVGSAFEKAGLPVQGELFCFSGFEPPVHDDWNAFDF